MGTKIMLTLGLALLLFTSGCLTTVYRSTRRPITTTHEERFWVEGISGFLDRSIHSRIAVYPFNGISTDASYYTTAVENWLTNNAGVTIVSRQNIELVITEQNLGREGILEGRLNESTMARLREIFGVKVIITGEINSNNWSLQAIDSETAQVLWGRNGLGSFAHSFPDVLLEIYGTDGHHETRIIEETVYIERRTTG